MLLRRGVADAFSVCSDETSVVTTTGGGGGAPDENGAKETEA